MATFKTMIVIVIMTVSLFLVPYLPLARSEAPFNPSPPILTSTGSQDPSIGQVDPSGMVYEGGIGYKGAPLARDFLDPSDTINASNTLLQTVSKMISQHGFFKTIVVIVLLFVIAPAVVCILLGKCVKGGCGKPDIDD